MDTGLEGEGMQVVAQEVELLSRQAAQVMEHIRFYRKIQQHPSRLSALAEISKAAHGSLELPEVLDRIVRKTAEVPEGVFFPFTHGGEASHRHAGADSGVQHAIERSEQVQRAIRDQGSYRIGDLWAEPDLALETFKMVRVEKLRSFLGVPVISDGRTLAVLSVYGAEPDRFSSDEVERLSAIARRTADAIRNAQRYAEIETLTRRLEKQLRTRTEVLETVRKALSTRVEALGSMRDELAAAKRLATVGKLAAGLAHEINNPLGIIKNYLRLISGEVGEEGPVSEFLSVVDNEVERVARTVRELLDMSRPPERRLEPMDLNRAVEELVAITWKPLLEKQIEVKTDLAEELPPVLASPDGIKEVFLNLIKNAEHAMPEGGMLTIKTEADGSGIRAIFSDTGRGISPEDLAHIFDPFFSTKEEAGTGLGLAVSQQVIERFGGKIEVESTPGEGSTFTVWLPLRPIQLSLEEAQEGTE